jgi:hypothetical protein
MIGVLYKYAENLVMFTFLHTMSTINHPLFQSQFKNIQEIVQLQKITIQIVRTTCPQNLRLKVSSRQKAFSTGYMGSSDLALSYRGLMIIEAGSVERFFKYIRNGC